jgi:hypothetical protein
MKDKRNLRERQNRDILLISFSLILEPLCVEEEFNRPSVAKILSPSIQTQFSRTLFRESNKERGKEEARGRMENYFACLSNKILSF